MFAKLTDHTDVYYGNLDTQRGSNSPYRARVKRMTPISKKYSFINGTNYGVVVVDRNGAAFVCKRSTDGAQDGNFIIEVAYQVINHQLPLFIRNIEDTEHHGILETKLILEECRTKRSYGHNDYVDITIIYTVNVENLFRAKDNKLYIQAVDLVLTLDTVKDLPPHPYAAATKNGVRQLFDTGTVHDGDAVYHMEIVDNDDEFGKRYINCNGSVLCIRPKKMDMRQNGVYVRRSDENLIDGRKSCITVEYYSFEEAVKSLNLYLSVQEAKSLGDNLARNKREISDREHKLKQDELALKERLAEAQSQSMQAKHEHERRMAEQRTAMEEQKLEHDRKREEFKLELDRRKADLEENRVRVEREHQRKREELDQERAAFERSNQRLKAHQDEMLFHRNAQINDQNHYYERQMQQVKHNNDTVKGIMALGASLIGLLALAYKFGLLTPKVA